MQNDFYEDEEELAMDYAVAVNEELRALKATGVDVVQLDEPWVRTAPDKAIRYGIRAINRALEGIEGPTVVHVCFGYAAVVSEKPSGYGFLAELGDTVAQQISIEAAQPRLDLGVLRDLAGKTIMLGRAGSGRPNGGDQPPWSRRASAMGCALCGRQAGSGARLRHEVPCRECRLREVASTGGRGRARQAGTGG